MKRLLLALLVSTIAITASGQTPKGGACSYWRVRVFYQYAGGPACGKTFYYCDRRPEVTGCQTAYYDETIWCGCP